MASIIIPEGPQDLNDILALTNAGPRSDSPSAYDIQRRIFIGPMPERVIAQTVDGQPKQAKLNIGSVFSLNQDNTSRSGDKSEEVTRVLKDNAFKFFLHRGGNADDWREDDDQDLIDELVHMWKGSEWGQFWERRHQGQKQSQSRASNQWFGASFEVGNLLGVDVIHSQRHLNAFSLQCLLPKETGVKSSNRNSNEQLPSSRDLSTLPALDISQIDRDTGSLNGGEDNGEFTSTSKVNLTSPQHAPENTMDRKPSSEFNVPEQDIVASVLDSERRLTAEEKGKAKVHYSDTPEDNSFDSISGLAAAPEEVLERTKATVDRNTSLAATFVPDTLRSPTPSEFSWGDVVLRDRMLVRVNYTKSEGYSQFDDNINRSARDLEYKDWGEFLVVWRRDSVELYKDYGVPLQEWATGHKQLAYVIPLRSSRTKLSLYSFVDLTFCITCAPTTRVLNDNGSRWIFSREKEGTQIFVFKLRSRSRAHDWYWQLWRQLGGDIPRSIDVHSPGLNTKVTIDIPDNRGNTLLYRIFARENLIQLCLNSLRRMPDYKYLIEKALEYGRSPQLVWRYQTNLDWVWLDQDVFGKPREWSVLCGLAFKQTTRPPILEIRFGEHAPNSVYLKDKKKIEEPPAIEGYLDSIKPNKQAKQPVYLATHSGYLFFINPGRPFPPTPPGAMPMEPSTKSDTVLRHMEIRRGINQIVHATSMMDLRSIVAVRRAFQPVSSQIHTMKEVQEDDHGWFEGWVGREERSSEDDVDAGGESALGQAYNSGLVKIRRSFELLLNTGQVMRFETYSCKVAIEWIERLRALSSYWKKRHRTDAQQEIELAQGQRPRLTPLTRVCHYEHEATSESTGSVDVSIDAFYNWCVLEGCKPIAKGGRIYMRKGLRGQFKLVQLFLIAGHLVSFRIDGQSSLYPSTKKKINLVEAYVCSGYFAAQTLPRGQYRPNTPAPPRRYGDGLETDDREEDMIFMIWYRPYSQMLHADQDPTTTYVDHGKVPNLSKKLKVLLFKTRSCLERDAWCWAINSEIEKIMRAQVKRETRLAEAGNLVPLTK